MYTHVNKYLDFRIISKRWVLQVTALHILLMGSYFCTAVAPRQWRSPRRGARCVGEHTPLQSGTRKAGTGFTLVLVMLVAFKCS